MRGDLAVILDLMAKQTSMFMRLPELKVIAIVGIVIIQDAFNQKLVSPVR